MSGKKEFLPAIFEPALSLDNKKAGTPRSIHLFERMAARLDEIAANTRGWVKCATARPEKQAGKQASRKEDKRLSRPVIASSKDEKTSSIGNLLPDASKSGGKATASQAGQSSARAENLASSSEHQSNTTGKKNTRDTSQKDSKPLSAMANDKAREERNAEESGNRIADTVLGGLNKIGSLIKSGANSVSDNNTAKETVGYGLGGPFYGALKEIREALPEFSSAKPDDKKERKKDSKKLINAIQNRDGKKRDEKGRFIGSDQNAARRQIAQTEVIEAQLALDEKEAKKDEKRHKELIRAVRANKRGMLDRFLDRRMGLGRRGRDRVIERGKSGKKGIRARGPRPDSRLNENGRSRRDRDLGERSDRSRRERDLDRRRDRARRDRDLGRRGDRKGILSRAGAIAQGAGKAVTGTLAVGGRALGGMARMLPGIGQALALGLAVYDGFQGWNDKELHQQAFGLKEGQEATTGQKASAATASILDMGGLTSGLLGMFGIEFDKAGVAKSIYEFGSNIGKLASDVMTVAGPILASAWKGLEDLGGKIWNGAKDIGGSIAGFATGIWEKGTQFASDIGAWAKGAISEGAGLITEIWNDAKAAVSGCWASLSNFAAESIAKGGKILSGLWEKATELPGKIVDGAADLAKSAIDGGGKLLSKGWNAVKDWGASLFGDDEAKAETVNQDKADLPVYETPATNKDEKIVQGKISNVSPVASETSANLNPVEITLSENRASSPLQPGTEAKLSTINKDDNAKISVNSSEAVSSALSLEQMKQNDIENKSQNKIIDNLEQVNENIKKVETVLKEEFEKNDLPNQFGIADAIHKASETIQTARQGGSVSWIAPTGYTGGGSSGISFAYNPDSKLGDTIARFESGNEGVHKIGYDRQGGTSYGKWQLSSTRGSYEEWLKLLENKGGQHAEIARQLRAAGPTNTGSRKGHHVDVYKKLAAENAQLFEDTQRESLMKHNYNVAMKGIKSDSLRKMIEGDKSLQEMMFSTSVQHGGGGARNIFNSVYQEGMSREQLIDAVYAKRAGQFGKLPELSKGLNARFREERDLILGMKNNPESVKAFQANITGGGSSAVNAGMSAMVAAATQTAIDNNVKYKMGAKNSAAGQIDCSGWVSEMGQRTMAEMNNAMGAEVFSKEARRAFKQGAANEGAAGIIRAVSNWNGGQLLTNEQLSPEQAREGMVIGLAKSGDKRVSDRFMGIGHIVQTYRDPQTGELMVSESRGGKGVMHSRYSDWYARHQKKGYKMYGTDLSSMADSSRVKATPQSLAAKNAPAASATPAITTPANAQSALPTQAAPVPVPVAPASMAQTVNPVPIAMSTREPMPVQSIREIDPAREVKTSSSDNGPILKILGEILAAIRAGNMKPANSGNNEDPPSIRMDYDDPAAQGLAADTA